MSSFICEKCGANILDSPGGYITGCEHYPMKYEIQKPSNAYPKEFKYILEKDIKIYLAAGWRLTGIQPINSSVVNFLVEKDG